MHRIRLFGTASFWWLVHYLLVPPDNTGVILGACDDGVRLVVEGDGEDLVAVSFEFLELVSSLDVPNSSGGVLGGGQDLGSLAVEPHLGDGGCVSDEYHLGGIVNYVVYSTGPVCRNRSQFGTCGVESDIEYFIGVAQVSEYRPWLSRIPELASSIQGACSNVISSEIEHSITQFSSVFV